MIDLRHNACTVRAGHEQLGAVHRHYTERKHHRNVNTTPQKINVPRVQQRLYRIVAEDRCRQQLGDRALEVDTL